MFDCYYKGLQTYIFAPCYTNNMKKISAIVFDLGGVLLNLDQDRTLRAFGRYGLDLEMVNDQSSLFTDFETGKIRDIDFRQGIQTALKGTITNAQIDEAWNAMLLFMVEERFGLVEQLKSKYDIYLLSNTNSIHIDWFRAYLDETFGQERWNRLFKHQFLSYEIGLRKPHTNIYEYVLGEINCEPQQVVFIDDSLQNLKGAAQVGMHTVHARNPLDEKLLSDIQHTIEAWHKLHS
jgi:putative hydrolase of the HAD superfamily